MDDDLEILFDRDEIRVLVEDLAARISRDYSGKDLVLVGVLKGAAPFLADLSLAITLPLELAFVEASSYGSGTTSSGTVQTTGNLDRNVTGRHVLVVDCIVDTGRTLAALLDLLLAQHPASVEAAVLLDKRARRAVDVPVKYVGTEVPDRFLVGYGLDKDQQYRNLPYIAAVAEKAKA
jgi:hypoxanthine phosphoribosyltransferase